MPEGDRLQLRSTVATHQARHELTHGTLLAALPTPFHRPIDQATDHPYIRHAKASMTLDIYADLFDEDLDGVADRLDAAIQATADALRMASEA